MTLALGPPPFELADLSLAEAAAVIETTPPPPLSRHDRTRGG